MEYLLNRVVSYSSEETFEKLDQIFGRLRSGSLLKKAISDRLDRLQVDRLNYLELKKIVVANKIVSLKRIMVRLDRSWINWRDVIGLACYKRHHRMVLVLIDFIKEFPFRNSDASVSIEVIRKRCFNEGLLGASRANDRYLVDIMISNGADCYLKALYHSCLIPKNQSQLGENLFEFFISKVAQNDVDWNTVLSYAAKGGRFDLIDLAVQHGEVDWRRAYSKACESNHLDVLELIFSRIHLDQYDLDEGFFTACWYGQFEVMKMLLERGVNPRDCLTSVIRRIGSELFSYTHLGLSSSRYKEIHDLQIAKIGLANMTIVNWANCLEGACLSGNLEIVKSILSELVKLDPELHIFDNRKYFEKACYSGSKSVIELLTPYGDEAKWMVGLVGACQGGHLEIAQMMLDKMDLTRPLTYSVNECLNNALLVACQDMCPKNKVIDLVNLLFSVGADNKYNAQYHACSCRHHLVQYEFMKRGFYHCRWCNQDHTEKDELLTCHIDPENIHHDTKFMLYL